ncbi:MAG: SDR family oxidoreductase [Candidatus Harrisonbacteria bacterium]|nr:SDR family oxidoreductase [Candidatus Harrisonbacteria bacterium]
MRLKNKVAIITGGANGIGKGIVNCMAKEGAIAIIADRDIKQAEEVMKFCADSYGTRGLALQVDVTKEQETRKAIKRVIDDFSGIDILVNNVGVTGKLGMPFTNNTEEDWDLVWDVNVKPVFYAAKAIAPHFQERKSGRIINMSSIAGFMPGLTKPHYSVSKVGIATFTQILAHEFAPYGVTVNAIAPGLVWTPLWEGFAPQLVERWPEKYKKMSPRQIFNKHVSDLIPLKREQTPEDIGMAAVFLASDEAKNITGQILFVDGGAVMR